MVHDKENSVCFVRVTDPGGCLSLTKPSLDTCSFSRQILAKIKDWAVERCPDGVECESVKIGESYEGRPIQVFKVRERGSDRPIDRGLTD